MDLSLFGERATGVLVPVSGSDPSRGRWEHRAFVPFPLTSDGIELSPSTYLTIGGARAALAALDATSQQLPNPTLLRAPTLRREAQSTSALEGTYAPMAEVFTADEESPPTPQLVEVLNYVAMADWGFARLAEGYRVSVPLLSELQGKLMAGTKLAAASGTLRSSQVVVGQRNEIDPAEFPIKRARFVPPPAGLTLEVGVRDLTAWMNQDHSSSLDPVVAAAMAHYQFETLHPFVDGNGRVGRYLIVLHLLAQGVLSEPTLTVSPWFEARRTDYYDALFGVSSRGDWDAYIRFFANGLENAAIQTRHQMIALVAVQAELRDRLRASNLRADTAHALVDLAVANPSFTVRRVESELGLSYARANKLVGQLVELEILKPLDPHAYKRRFYSPSVLAVLMS